MKKFPKAMTGEDWATVKEQHVTPYQRFVDTLSTDGMMRLAGEAVSITEATSGIAKTEAETGQYGFCTVPASVLRKLCLFAQRAILLELADREAKHREEMERVARQ
jgi:hypothetical protein